MDPGPALDAHLDAIVAATGAPVRWILTTHTHRDHSPAARELKRRTGARVLGMPPPDDGSHNRDFVPDSVLGDGDRLRVEDATLRAIHTPGHASNHLCFLLGDPYTVINRIISHRMAREAKVMAGMDRLREASKAHPLAEVYEDVPTALHAVAGRSLLAHLIKLRDEGALCTDGSILRLAG